MLQLASLKHTSGGVKILWKRTPECSARFTDLFEPIQDIQGITIKTYILKQLKIKLPVYSNVKVFLRETDASLSDSELSSLKNKVGSNHFFLSEEEQSSFVKAYLRDRGRGDYFLSTCHQLFGRQDFSYFIPNENLRIRIAELETQLGKNSVGIHIRRTDNTASIEQSPLSLFIQKMETEVNMNPSVRFFLTTDDLSVKKKLYDRFHGHIVVNNMNQVSRADLAGMQDAVVDLWTLSKTGKIFGSYWSSFSVAASCIGHIPLEVMYKT